MKFLTIPILKLLITVEESLKLKYCVLYKIILRRSLISINDIKDIGQTRGAKKISRMLEESLYIPNIYIYSFVPNLSFQYCVDHKLLQNK